MSILPFIYHSAGAAAIVAVLAVVPVQSVKAANNCLTVGAGNWSAPTTWTNCSGGVPDAADSVEVAPGHIVTVDSNAAAASVIVAMNSAAGDSGINIASGKTLSVSGSIAIVAPITATSSINVGDGFLQAGNIIIMGGGVGRFATLSVNNGSVTTTGSVTFMGFAGQARYISTGASTTTVGGNFSSGGSFISSGTGTFIFNGSGAQTIGEYTTYYNVIINASGIVTFAGNAVIAGDVTVNSGTLVVDSIDLTIGAKTTINGGALVFSSTAGAKMLGCDTIINSGGQINFTDAEDISTSGNLTVNGTGAIVGTSGVWTFQKAGGAVIGGTSVSGVPIGGANFVTNTSLLIPVRFSNVNVVAGAKVTNNSVATINTDLGGGGQFIQGTGSALELKGNTTITTLNASADANIVRYTRTTGTQNIRATAYHDLLVSVLGHAGTLDGAVTVDGDLTVNAGNLNDNGFQITGNATGTLTLASDSTLTIGKAASATSFPTGFASANIHLNGTSTVNYSADASQTIASAPTYGNLKTTATAAVTKTAAGALTIDGNFTNDTNNTFDNAGFVATVKGNSVMNGPDVGSGKILLSGGTAVHLVSGEYTDVELNDSHGVFLSDNVKINGKLNIANGAWDATIRDMTVTDTTTVGGALVLSDTSGAKTLSDVVVNNGGQVQFNAAEDVAIGSLTVNGTGAIAGATGMLTFNKPSGGHIAGTSPHIIVHGNNTFTTNYEVTVPYQASEIAVNTGATLTNSSALTSAAALTGGGTLTQASGATLNLAGTITIAGLQATANNNTVNYNGASAQTIKATMYDTLAVGLNTSGAVDIAANTSANKLLALGATKLTTHANVMELAADAVLTRTSGYVVGSLRKDFNASGSFAFAVGDAGNYAPIDLTITNLTATGSVTASTTYGDHADTTAGTSLVDPNKSVNRVWSLVNSGVAFTSYNATLHFAGSDVDAGVDVPTMIVSKKSAGTWTAVPAVCAGVTCAITNVASMSEFQAGDASATEPPIIPPVTPPTTPGATPGTSSTGAATTGQGTTSTGSAAPTTAGTTSGEPRPLFDVSSEFGLANTEASIWAAIILGIIIGVLLAVSIIYERRKREKQKLKT